MREQLEIVIPTDWSDITLRQYLDLQKDLESYKDDTKAQEAFLLLHLCGLDGEKIGKLTTVSYNELISNISNLFKNREHNLQTSVKFGDTDYGFEPNLSKMSYGAYVDISKYESIAIDDNWSQIMNILYRPIEKVFKGYYTIKQYDGNLDNQKWYDVTMDVHFGAYFFFVRLLKGLQNSTLNSTMQTSEIPHSIKSILEKSGKLIQQSYSWQEEIFKK